MASILGALGLRAPVVGREYVTRDDGPFGPVAVPLEVRGQYVQYEVRRHGSRIKSSSTCGLFFWQYTEKTE